MKLTRTVKLKLDIPAEAIRPTIQAYTQAFNLVCQIGWEGDDRNGVSLHRKTYADVRSFLGLPSQLAVSARMKATEALQSAHAKIKKGDAASCPHSRRSSIRFDARSYNVWFERKEVSILTLAGRKKFLLEVPKYFQRYLTWRRCSADLFLRKNQVYLHIVFEKDVPDLSGTPAHFLGIDRGECQLAVTSDNQFFRGGRIRQYHRRYDRLRSRLRSACDRGKRGVKRHLVQISNKANRFQKDVNHRISKRIVDSLPEGSAIVLENLKNIRSTGKRKGSENRRNFHRWSFFQLEQYLLYKASAKGIAVEYVDARYTSRKCSNCGHIEKRNRVSQSVFVCRKCGFHLHADLNASRNIRNNHLDAICHPSRAVCQSAYCSPSGSSKPPDLSGGN